MTSAMKVNLKQIFNKWSKASSSQVFVTVSVVNTMPQPRLSQRSAKVIIRVSIWTCLVLVFLFFSFYTILLICVDKQMHPDQLYLPYKKIRLLGKINSKYSYSVAKSGKDNISIEKAAVHRIPIWNSSLYYSREESLPLCKLQTFIIMLVTSSPENSDRRMAIRNSWCNPQHFSASEQAWQCIFLVGLSDNDTVNSYIRTEKALHNDILFGSYIDSYRNLTLKVLHGFNWSTNYCSSSYVVKTDDDCFVNAGLLYTFLRQYNHITSDLYVGNVLADKTKLKVIRGAEKKWSVRYEEYSKEYYPPYASGIGYVLSADVVKQLVAESMYVYPIANEDAYIGIVISQLGITPVRSDRFLLSSSGLSVCNYLYVFIVHHVQSDVQAELLRKAIESRTTCKHLAIITWN